MTSGATVPILVLCTRCGAEHNHRRPCTCTPPVYGPVTELEHLRAENNRLRRRLRWADINLALYSRLVEGREQERAGHRQAIAERETRIDELLKHRKWESEVDQIRSLLGQIRHWLSDPRPAWQDAAEARRIIDRSGLLPTPTAGHGLIPLRRPAPRRHPNRRPA